MTPEQYKSTRQRLGTQAKVAAMLGVSRECVSRRETGKDPLTKEAQLAIKAITQKKAKKEEQ